MALYYPVLALAFLLLRVEQIAADCSPDMEATLSHDKTERNELLTLTCKHPFDHDMNPWWIINDHTYHVTSLPKRYYSATRQTLQLNCTDKIKVRCFYTEVTGGDNICSDTKLLKACGKQTPSTPLRLYSIKITPSEADHAHHHTDCIIEVTFFNGFDSTRVDVFTATDPSSNCKLSYNFTAPGVENKSGQVELKEKQVSFKVNCMERFYSKNVTFEVKNTCATNCSTKRYILPNMSKTDYISIRSAELSAGYEILIEDLSRYGGELEECDPMPQPMFCYTDDTITSCSGICGLFKIPICQDSECNSRSLVVDNQRARNATILSIFSTNDSSVDVKSSVLDINLIIYVCDKESGCVYHEDSRDTCSLVTDDFGDVGVGLTCYILVLASIILSLL